MATAQPTSPAGVVNAIVTLLERSPQRVRLLIDGAPASRPDKLAELLVTALSPRPSLHLRAELFWQPASLRFESGRQDPDAWLHRWLDERTLQREALQSFAHSGEVLPGLRDPVTDRSLRLAPVFVPPGGVLVVSGNALIGRGLEVDRSVHIHLSEAALGRRTPTSDHWLLPALAQYEASGPDTAADLVIRADDPRHPALVRRVDEP